MTNHPNRNWRKKWQVDLSTCRAIHSTGLIVEFKQSPDGGWDGTSQNCRDIFQEINQDTATRLARLLSEAGDIYKERLGQRQ